MAKIEYNFQRLEAWKLGMELVKKTYRLSKDFPDEEKFGLTSQTRRAATSVPLNIAEGSNRRGKKEFSAFIGIAIGSLMEVVTCFEIARDLAYINTDEHARMSQLIQELYFKLIALKKSLKNNDNN